MLNDTNRRYVRDTVANDWAPAWKPELDRRMVWLDKVEQAIKEVDSGR